MSEIALGREAAAVRLPAREAIHRAMWRWHFYAGLLVLPFLILLAVTGGLYLFHDEIDGWVHRDLLSVEARATPALQPEELTGLALQAAAGTVTKYLPPAGPARSAEVGMKSPEGTKFSVFLDPYDGQVLGRMDEKSTVMGIVRRLHSLALFGTWPSYVIEIVAGWTVILVATGIYLWWPRRRQKGAVVSLRGTKRQRVFWRDLHAVTGLVAGAFIVFLAVTGLPWSSYWGGKSLALLESAGLGFPTGVWGSAPVSTVPLQAVVDDVGWTMQQAPVPTSPSADGHHHGAPPAATSVPNADLPPPIGLDRAVRIFDGLGLAPGYAVALPGGADGVYTGSAYPDDLDRQRVIHLDQYSGRPIIDVGFADYGLGGKAIEWGINVHMGQEFGPANKVVMALVCVAIVLMAVSSLVMWWKRRPQGGMGVPAWPQDRRAATGVTALVLGLGLLFPLTGLSILAVLALDLLGGLALRRLRPA
ncbi:PepSY-associated TM helix domain-containing protein [Geminicoccus roseus]|uniref:PepSY-associated TM helix domain-containing protein n=1 Tax=Geminicoccus roseus TaxID=404900 RepID=UPI0004091BA7|nr:PepSY domain-containing protein [Geminicoccus roseus]